MTDLDLDLLTNTDLEEYAKKLKIPLHAAIQKDLFSRLTPKQGGYIINLQDSTIGNGSHWTAMYIFDKHVLYYDPFGFSVPTPIMKFLSRYKKIKTILRSTDQIQESTSIRCGWYSLYFLYFMNRFKGCKDKRLLMNRHNALYSIKNKELNDRKLQQLIKTIM